MVVNTSIRMAYPFLAFFAAGMGVDITMASLAVSLSMTASAVGPFIAPIADRHGRRVGMLLGLGIFTLGMGLVVLLPGYWTFLLAILLGNLGDNVFLPAMHAFLSDRVPYEKRGLVIAVTEISWALCFILLIPLVGMLMEATTWYMPFAALGILGLASIGGVLLFVRNDVAHPTAGSAGFFDGMRRIFTIRMAVVALVMGFAIIVANDVVNTMFGVWMKDSFGLEMAAIGFASVVIGFSELGGEGLAAWVTDRLGKERTVTLGLIANTIIILSLPVLGRALAGALVWLFLFYLTFELTIVALMPLMTELIPSFRATYMALAIAVFSLGRGAGALLAPFLYRGGFLFNGAAAVVANTAAFVLLRMIHVKPQPVRSE